MKAIRWSYVVTAAWLVAATIFFGASGHRFYPIQHWLFFFWARAWAGALLFGVPSLAVGVRLLPLLRVRAVPLAERFALAMALGVLVFALGIYVVGLLGFLGRVFFFLWPATLLMIGGRPLARHVRHVLAWLRRASLAALAPRTVPQVLASLFLLAGCFGVYLQVITPANVGWDARWYHVPIAESYAAAGRIRPFPEGWYLGAYPHLQSWLFAWAFLAPGTLQHHLCLVQHVQYVVLLATLVGVAAFARRLLGGVRVPGAAAAMFLFPGLAIYDANLNGNADHMIAFWVPAIGIALFRYLANADLRRALLLGAVIAGAALTKYQVVYLLPGIALVLLVHAAHARAAVPLLAAGLTALLLSSPHWLKNWIAYGDPLYPNLHRWLHDRPFFSGAEERLIQHYHLTGIGPRTVAKKLRDTLYDMFAFSFAPKGWAGTAKGAPLFGSLFTLTLPLTLWVRPRWRVLVVVGCVLLGLAVWALTYPDDRYLQAMLPWMAALVAVTIAAAWRTKSSLVRGAVVLLVGLQVVWGGDAFFFRNGMGGEGTLKALVDYMSAGQEKSYTRRQYPGEQLEPIGAGLPRSARVIGHDFYQSLGVGAWIIVDDPFWQGAIEYLQTDSPAAAVGLWRRLGATHILWPDSKEPRAPSDIARDAVFARTAALFAGPPQLTAGYDVAELVPAGTTAAGAPTDATLGADAATRIAWLACGTARAIGIYTPQGLADGTIGSALDAAALASQPASAMREVNAAAVSGSCPESDAARPFIDANFRRVMQTGDVVIWARQM